MISTLIYCYYGNIKLIIHQNGNHFGMNNKKKQMGEKYFILTCLKITGRIKWPGMAFKADPIRAFVDQDWFSPFLMFLPARAGSLHISLPGTIPGQKSYEDI